MLKLESLIPFLNYLLREFDYGFDNLDDLGVLSPLLAVEIFPHLNIILAPIN